jgi:hypothetical protein
VVLIRAEMACADERIGSDAAAKTAAYAEIVAQHGTQQKWLDQVMKDIAEEPDLEKQLMEKIAAKTAELCPEGGKAPADAAPADAAPADAAPADAAPADAAPAGDEAPAADEAVPATE